MRTYKQILIENTIWVYVAKLVAQLIGLIASVLVIRQLAVDVYGTYVFLFGLFTAYQLLITSPLRHVLLRFIPEFKSSLSGKALTRILSLYIFIAIVMVLALTILAVLFRGALATFFNIENFDSYLVSFLFFVLTYALKILLEIVLSALLLHRHHAVLNVVVVLIRAVTYITLLSSLSVNLLLQIEALVSIVYAVLAILLLYYKLDTSNGSLIELSKENKKRVKRFWFLSLFTELGAGIIGRTSDYYIIAALSNPYYVGLYGFAVKIYELFYKVLPLRELESVLKPLFFLKFSAKASYKTLNAFYNFSIKVLLPIFIFPVLYFLIFGRSVIVEVFGEKYIEAYWTTFIILLSILLDGFFYPLGMLIQLKEKLQVVVISRIVVLFSLLVGILLMKLYGIIGVAIATLMGELIKNLIMFFLFRSYCKIKYSKRMLLTYLGIILFTLFVFFPWQSHYSGVVIWLVASVCYLFLFVFLLVNFHPLSKVELNELDELLTSSKKINLMLKPIRLVLNKLVVFNRFNG